MKKTLYDYKEAIKKLPLKDKYTKEELLTDDFLVDKEGNIEIYYAPHNEYINPKAKVFIIGITPGCLLYTSDAADDMQCIRDSSYSYSKKGIRDWR